jgi:hypothetical protein
MLNAAVREDLLRIVEVVTLLNILMIRCRIRVKPAQEAASTRP